MLNERINARMAKRLHWLNGMKISAAVTASTLAIVCFAAVHAAAQGRDRDSRDEDRVCFYKDVNFQGAQWCYRPGDELADLRDRRNEISSIRVFGRARVIVYDQREFQGAADEFDMDVPDLTLRNMEGSRNWNDHIDSFQVESGGRRRTSFGFPGFGRPDDRDRDRDRENRDDRLSRDRICVYEEPGYRGRSQCWDAGEEERNLNRTNGWNDRINSIRVFGRARVELYRDADYHGQRLRIERDTPDLRAINWGDQVSSFAVK